MRLIALIDRWLNGITMYRLVLGLLIALALVAVAMEPVRLETIGVLLAACLGANWLFAKIVRACSNRESTAITAFILFFILFPAERAADLRLVALCGVVAIASKYLITIRNRHVFNPAAVGALTAGFVGWGAAWWIATPAMAPFVLVAGILVARKTRRLTLLATFVAVTLLTIMVLDRFKGLNTSFIQIAMDGIFSWPILFFGAFMLTEPLTLPATRRWQFLEAILIGVFFSVPYHIGPLRGSPELTLLLGNAFAFVLSKKATYRLSLREKQELAPGIFEWSFHSDRPVFFAPGQYLEWTLPHEKHDVRGTRRTFTVASAPLEHEIRLCARVPNPSSSFKRSLSSMKPGDVIAGSNVGGEFILPHSLNTKIICVAGGIGITPFRSMVADMIEKNERRDLILVYCAKGGEHVYRDVFERAAPLGVRVVYVDTEREGHLDPEKFKSVCPDFLERRLYLSGTNAMVTRVRALAIESGVPRSHIHTDYFPGY